MWVSKVAVNTYDESIHSILYKKQETKKQDTKFLFIVSRPELVANGS